MALLQTLISLYILLIFARSILSWFAPQRQGGAIAQVDRALFIATEPLLGPLRRALPRPGGAAAAVDFSPMVAIILLVIVRGLL